MVLVYKQMRSAPSYLTMVIRVYVSDMAVKTLQKLKFQRALGCGRTPQKIQTATMSVKNDITLMLQLYKSDVKVGNPL